MELFSIIWQFLLLWGFLYLIVFTLQIISTRKKEPPRRRNNSLLPTFSIVDNDKEPQMRDQWEIKLFQVKYTTQRLNNLFGDLTKLSPTFWNIWFTCGVIAASILIIVGMIVILFAATKILSSAKQIFIPSNNNNLMKRGLEGVDEDDQVFLPMVKKEQN